MSDNIKPEVIKTLRSKSLNAINQGNKRTKSINLDFTDINPTFLGNIVFHYPSQMERMKIGVIQSELLGGNLNVDIQTGNIAHIISTLEVLVDSKPDWFDVFNPDLEYEILEAVYSEYTEWSNSFRRPSEQPASGNSEDTGSTV